MFDNLIGNKEQCLPTKYKVVYLADSEALNWDLFFEFFSIKLYQVFHWNFTFRLLNSEPNLINEEPNERAMFVDSF